MTTTTATATTATSRQPFVAAILLNWKRTEDLHASLAAIRKQSVPIDIYLWNNNPACEGERFDADVVINSSQNFRCIPRWFMASFMPPRIQYIFTLDDDMQFADHDAIAQCLQVHARLKQQQAFAEPIVGRNVVRLQPPYNEYVGKADKNGHGDIAKGQFMFMARSLLDRVTFPNNVTEDDIYISSFADTCFEFKSLQQMIVELPSSSAEMALWRDPGHCARRNDAVRRYIKPKRTKAAAEK